MNIQPEYLIGQFLVKHDNEKLTLSALTKALSNISRLLIGSNVTVDAGFRTDALGRLWSSETVLGLKRLESAGLVKLSPKEDDFQLTNQGNVDSWNRLFLAYEKSDNVTPEIKLLIVSNL